MAILSIIFFVFWKFFKRTNFKDPMKVNLVWECPQFDAYEEMEVDEPSTFWREFTQMLLFNCKKSA